MISQALVMQLLPGSTLSSIQLFEEEGDRLTQNQPVRPLVMGQSKVLARNIGKLRQFNRVVGFIIQPDTPAQVVSAKIQYSLEAGR